MKNCSIDEWERRERDRSGGLVISVKKEGREEEREGGITIWIELPEEEEERESGEGSMREADEEDWGSEGRTGWMTSYWIGWISCLSSRCHWFGTYK